MPWIRPRRIPARREWRSAVSVTHPSVWPLPLAGALIAGCFLLAGISGCAGEQRPTPESDDAAGALSISWVRPAPGAFLSDTIRCRVRIEAGRAVRAGLEADDSLVAVRDVEPWTFHWLPPDTLEPGSVTERTIRLRIAAWDTAGAASKSDPLDVRWIPNGVPQLRLLGIESPAWIERSAGESLRVVAFDPEDGILRNGSIEWRSDREGTIGYGERMPVEALIPGKHLLHIRATDSRLRAVSVQLVADVFDYSGGLTPEGVLEDLRYALLDRRADVYAGSLEEEFSFIFCPADRESDPDAPVLWDAAGEEQFVRLCLSRAEIRFLGADWTVASLQETRIGGEAGAKAEIAGIEINLTVAPGETLSVSGGSARAYLRSDRLSGRWRLTQWQDLGAGTAITQGRLRLEVARRAGRERMPAG